MEVEESQPPQKKLKQATLSFFKGRKDDKKAEPQGRKRQSSTGSDSPSKVAKLLKPLAVLSTSDSPNPTATQQNIRSSIHDSSDQEVSSSSEADSTGNKTNGKSLMDRFVKKVHDNCNQEISSTNNDVDSTGDNFHHAKSENDKENIFVNENEGGIEENNVDSDSDCVILSEESEKQNTNDKDKTDEIVSVQECSHASENNNLNENSDDVGKELKENEQNTSVANISDHETTIGTDTDVSRSIELDPNEESFNISLVEKSEYACTSTPAKAVKDSTDVETTPTCAASSSKKKGKKIDLAKKAEQEALKQKQKEEKEQQRLEKKRKVEEEKAEKERLRKEKLETKEKAKQELKEKQAQEKLEKDRLKEEEKLKREAERKLKEEEKLKKQAELEAKQEEKRKREEEKKLKDEEKQREEDEKRKKEEKVKMAFQSFFKAKETPQKLNASKSSNGFVPFELKKDMHLAPTLRRDALGQQKKTDLDQILQSDQSSTTTYLDQLRSKELKPVTIGRRLRKNPKPADEMDIEVIHDSEALKKVFHKVKILKFHLDNRPPYCGTWRKETKLTPRNPFKKDEGVFDYEVDSDEEWEEEEPGESLSCSDGEEEKEDNEEEGEDDWMVPHGYLSEDEGCNEDDDISPEKLKLQQIAKAKAWDEEQKRKFHALPVVVVGCFFEHSPSVTMSGDVRLLYQYKAVVLEKVTPIPTALSSAFEEPKCEEVSKENSQAASLVKGPKKLSVPDEAMPDLIRLLHGNIYGIKRLIKEFRVFWLQKNKDSSPCLNGSLEEDLDESVKDQPADVSMEDSGKDPADVLNKSVDANTSISKPKEEGHGCEISKRQLEIKIMAIAAREKREIPKKTAWFVHNNVLAEFGMENIELPNSWVFLTEVPSIRSTPVVSKDDESIVKKEEMTTPAKPTIKDQRSIMDFTMTKGEIEEMRQSQGGSSANSTDNLSHPVAVQPEIINEPVTPKDKKLSGQRSIFDFAKSKSAVKSCEKDKPKTVVVEYPDVIVLDDEEDNIVTPKP